MLNQLIDALRPSYRLTPAQQHKLITKNSIVFDDANDRNDAPSQSECGLLRTRAKLTMILLLIVIALLSGTTLELWAGNEEGKAAYAKGDYATALREWRALAEQGDAKGQNNLGNLYKHGQGSASR